MPSDAVEPPFDSEATLTPALGAEWFDREDVPGYRVICNGCGAIVDYFSRERHWRFHVLVTGNVHV